MANQPWPLGLALNRARRAYQQRRQQLAVATLDVTRQQLTVESQVTSPYLILVVSSCLIASFGLLANSAAVIIGAMLIAPLMLPIRAAAFGILEANRGLIRQSLGCLLVGSGLALAIATALAYLSGVAAYGSEVIGRSQPTLLDLGVAITAGALAAVAAVEPRLSSAVAGVAIAVALMPPLCVVGLWLAQANWTMALGSLLLYGTNLFGIILAAMVAFVVLGYVPLSQANRPLAITLVFTALLALPLGATTLQLLRQNQLEASLRAALVDRTLTFQRLRLVEMEVNWLSTPTEVLLTVRSADPVTAKQVSLLEAFLERELGRPFKLHFLVSYLEDITSDPQPNLPWRGN
jgi:uncharacterized hydrophobic protein (TIGR00271 family)